MTEESASREGRCLLELEERLAGDAGGMERDAVLAQLNELRAVAKRSLDQGVAPVEAKRWNALLGAIDAAGLVVQRVAVHLEPA